MKADSHLLVPSARERGQAHLGQEAVGQRKGQVCQLVVVQMLTGGLQLAQSPRPARPRGTLDVGG